MKRIANIAVIFAMASFAAFAHAQCSVGNGVQFCSPSNGAATGTSTTVSAAGASNIVAMKLYVDGQDPAADAVPRFQSEHVAACLLQGARCSQAGGASPDHDDIVQHNKISAEHADNAEKIHRLKTSTDPTDDLDYTD